MGHHPVVHIKHKYQDFHDPSVTKHQGARLLRLWKRRIKESDGPVISILQQITRISKQAIKMIEDLSLSQISQSEFTSLMRSHQINTENTSIS